MTPTVVTPPRKTPQDLEWEEFASQRQHRLRKEASDKKWDEMIAESHRRIARWEAIRALVFFAALMGMMSLGECRA